MKQRLIGWTLRSIFAKRHRSILSLLLQDVIDVPGMNVEEEVTRITNECLSLTWVEVMRPQQIANHCHTIYLSIEISPPELALE